MQTETAATLKDVHQKEKKTISFFQEMISSGPQLPQHDVHHSSPVKHMTEHHVLTDKGQLTHGPDHSHSSNELKQEPARSLLSAEGPGAQQCARHTRALQGHLSIQSLETQLLD